MALKRRAGNIVQALRETVHRLYYQLYPHHYCTYHRLIFSQDGEDCVLFTLLRDMPNGFYVEIGAHHPQRYSNTYAFYLQGWRGICVDASPDSMRLFKMARPRDICVECGVGNSQETLDFHIFNEPALNTFDKALAATRDGKGGYHIVRVQKLQIRPLRDILADHLPDSTEISFMSVDVEGYDLQVLESNDWARFRPRIVVAERAEELVTVSEAASDPTCAFLSAQGYDLISVLPRSLIFATRANS